MAKETAEQKLMKMMQKKGDSVATKASIAARKPAFTFSIAMLNQLLIVGIVACIIGLIIELRSGSALLEGNVDLADNAKVSQAVADIALPSGKAAAFYLDQVNTRNIFKPYEAQAAAKTNPTAQSLTKHLSKFKLVGIAWLDLPETASVMIEDTEAKATYFLKTGEQLEGVTVKTIYTDRAVFSYENEETTIKL